MYTLTRVLSPQAYMGKKSVRYDRLVLAFDMLLSWLRLKLAHSLLTLFSSHLFVSLNGVSLFTCSVLSCARSIFFASHENSHYHIFMPEYKPTRV